MDHAHTTKAEMETHFRYDEEERILHMWTANPAVARSWRRLGFDVRVLGSVGGAPRAWKTQGPVEALRLRRVENGAVVRRPPPPHAFKASTPAAHNAG
jgi:hypothetical protein